MAAEDNILFTRGSQEQLMIADREIESFVITKRRSAHQASASTQTEREQDTFEFLYVSELPLSLFYKYYSHVKCVLCGRLQARRTVIKRDAAVVARQVSAIHGRLPEEIRERGSRFLVLAQDSAPNFFFAPALTRRGAKWVASPPLC